MAEPLTFLFTDLENSTALWEQAPREMRRALADHDEILRASVEMHKGRIVNTTGDGIYAVFESASDAVLAALSGQQAMSAHIWPVETGPLKVRMGLHSGESEERAGDYYGTTVNEAARIMALGHGGQILLSEVTVGKFGNDKPADISFIDLGAHGLKGLKRPEVIYQLDYPGLDAEFPPLKSPSFPKHDLPAQATPFIGREKEIEEISLLLRTDPACRLLTLLGPGGIGKTRIALEAAAHVYDSFSDGAHFISLAPVSKAAFIVPTIAEALGLNFQGEAEPKTQLLHHLREKNYLLVMDNFEQLLGSAPGSEQGGEGMLSELLGAVPNLKILVTSRERLNLQEEWLYEIQGMPFPQYGRPASDSEIDEIVTYGAVELFLHCARRADANFSYTAGDLDAVIRVCRLVDGLPLGIELAAPWVRLMTIQEIADEIERSLDLLTTSLRNIPERHRSMRVIFEQTWQQLSPEERAILGQLSIFRGGCLRDAAEYVTGATLHQLSTLVEKALLRRRKSGRYDLHELVRQFALEQIQQTSDIYAQTMYRHYRFYSAFLEKRVADLKGSAQMEALELITADIDNVRTGWQQAVENRDSTALKQAAECLYLYSELGGALAEGETAFRQAAAAFDPRAKSSSPAEMRLRAFLLAGQGSLAAHRGNLKEGRLILEQSLALWESENEPDQDPEIEAFILLSLGWVYFLLAENERVEAILQESLAIYDEIGDRWGVAKCLTVLGNSRTGSGRLAEAESPLRQSLLIAQETGDHRNQLLVDWNLAILTFWFGDYPQTERFLTDAVRLARELDDKIGLALAMKEFGKLDAARGDYHQAVETLRASIAITDAIGSQWESAATLDDLGNALLLRGDYAGAENALKQCLQAAQARQHRYFIARCLGDLGFLSYRMEQHQRAEQYLHQALELWTALGHEPYRAWVLCQMGHTLQGPEKGRYEEAGQNYGLALRLSVKHDLAPIAMDIFVGAARLLWRVNAQQAAIGLLQRVASHPAAAAAARELAGQYWADLGLAPRSDREKEAGTYQEQAWQATAEALIDELGAVDWDQLELIDQEKLL